MSKPKQHESRTSGPKLWVVMARAYAATASYIEQSIARQGLCLSDFMVLEVLLHKGPMSISAIGEKVLLANASMTSAVDRLEERGLVVRQSSTTDRRSKTILLTTEGRAFISDLYARHEKDIEAVTSVLTQSEANELRSLLKKIGRAAQSASADRLSAGAAPGDAKTSRTPA